MTDRKKESGACLIVANVVKIKLWYNKRLININNDHLKKTGSYLCSSPIVLLILLSIPSKCS